MQNRYAEINIRNIKVNAEVADTFLKRAKGLMGRKSLQENEGMLFIFKNEDYHGIWTINISIHIDIVFIDKNKIVVDIFRNVQPGGLSCKTYKPRKKSMYVLELKANFTKIHALKIGSKLDFKF